MLRIPMVDNTNGVALRVLNYSKKIIIKMLRIPIVDNTIGVALKFFKKSCINL